ncbi:MAG: hypothetical protein Q9159_002440 [Coniocarpon cinnabarinum]
MPGQLPQPIHTSYTSRHVDIPADFLTTAAPDSKPITANRIDFSKTPLPQYADSYAVILDNVLSQSECRRLIELAELSAPDQDKPWQPALVNMGQNYEVRLDDYRNSDRIIWDCPTLVDRIIERCFAADDGKIGEDLKEVSKARGNAESVIGERAAKKQTWTFTRGNERMRFLKYEKGGFFNRHNDGSYESFRNPSTGKPYERTLYTLHLYLNGDGLGGGETTFWSRYGSGRGKGGLKEMLGLSKYDDPRVDVKASSGRVLIFQHRGLLHSGEQVRSGVKFTMRTDLLYSVEEVENGEGKADLDCL